MITRISGTANGWKLGEDATVDELRAIGSAYDEVRCIITNYNTRKRFGIITKTGKNLHTINNHVGDAEFYINAIK